MNTCGIYVESPEGKIDESLKGIAENLISVLGQQSENLSKIIDYLDRASGPGVINISGCNIQMDSPVLPRHAY